MRFESLQFKVRTLYWKVQLSLTQNNKMLISSQKGCYLVVTWYAARTEVQSKLIDFKTN